jgi:hypothetical protein
MHAVLVLLLVILLLWFMFPKKSEKVRLAVLPGAEPYKNEPSRIVFPNAEFKFYK